MKKKTSLPPQIKKNHALLITIFYKLKILNFIQILLGQLELQNNYFKKIINKLSISLLD